jgi:hypothetical protein
MDPAIGPAAKAKPDKRLKAKAGNINFIIISFNLAKALIAGCIWLYRFIGAVVVPRAYARANICQS